MKKNFFILTVATILLASCNNQIVKSIANQSFQLTELNGKALLATEEIQPTIAFTDKEVNATVGCNQIFAHYTATSNGKLTFSNGGATKMMCPEELREDEFLKAFNKVVRYTIKDKTISFFDAENNLIFKARITK